MDIALLTAAIIIIICIMANNISSKIGVPSLLLFLILGMIFNKMYNFNDYVISSNICTVTLIFIMFYGGFGTNWLYFLQHYYLLYLENFWLVA